MSSSPHKDGSFSTHHSMSRNVRVAARQCWFPGLIRQWFGHRVSRLWFISWIPELGKDAGARSLFRQIVLLKLLNIPHLLLSQSPELKAVSMATWRQSFEVVHVVRVTTMAHIKTRGTRVNRCQERAHVCACNLSVVRQQWHLWWVIYSKQLFPKEREKNIK